MAQTPVASDPQAEMDEVLSSIIVLIEWNGRKPSTTFYNRLHSYGLYSRVAGREMDGPVSLLEQRARFPGDRKSPSQHGVVFQEGAIIVSNMSLAKQIAQLAKEEGANLVHVGNVTTQEFHMTEKDYAVFQAVQQSVSKRGPKRTIESGRYLVTCFDEARSYVMDADSMPQTCPGCGGTNIQPRMGTMPVFIYPTSDVLAGDSLFDYWKRTRFARGGFEVPEIVKPEPGKTIPPAPPLTTYVKFQEPGLPDSFLKRIDVTDFSVMARIYDVCYCLERMSAPDRLQGRLRQINAYVVAQGTDFMSFNPLPSGRYDIVDLSIVDNAYSKYLWPEDKK